MNLVLFLVFVIVLSQRRSFHITPSNIRTSMLVITAALIFDYLCFNCNLLLLCGDVELNPGPKQNTAKKITMCHWNLNSIVAHNFAKYKAHGHKISIRMIKICGKSICKPLQLIFSQCIDTGSFPLEWKKTM